MSTIEEQTVKFDEAAKTAMDKMNALAEASKIHILQPEQIQLLNSFAKFKSGLKKPGVFTWQTQPYNVVEPITKDKE